MVFTLRKNLSSHQLLTVISLIALLILSLHCTAVGPDGIHQTMDDLAEAQAKPDLKIPTGDEIEVKLEIIEASKVLVTVTNHSSSAVFLPYLPGVDSDIAFYARLGLEKMDSETGKFESFEGRDFGTGSNSLESGKSFRIGLTLPEMSTYRLNVRYMIDEDLSDQLNRLAKSESAEDAQASKVDSALQVAVHTVSQGFAL